MDVYRKDIVTDCLKELRSHFDRDSFRVRRLEAMRAEMLEDWDLALEILDQILEEDDSNSQARKRKIAIYKARGENAKAINGLNKYLEDFMCDGEAWMELCEMYILEQEYTKAAFCCGGGSSVVERIAKEHGVSLESLSQKWTQDDTSESDKQ